MKKKKYGSKRKKSAYFWLMCICFFCTYACFMNMLVPQTLLFFLGFIVFLISHIVESRRWKKNPPPSEIDRRKAENQAKFERERLAAMDNRPVSSRIIAQSSNSTTKAGVASTAARATVGGVIAGPMGAMVGAATTKHKTQTTDVLITFYVTYESGRKGSETVPVGCDRFETLMDVLET